MKREFSCKKTRKKKKHMFQVYQSNHIFRQENDHVLQNEREETIRDGNKGWFRAQDLLHGKQIEVPLRFENSFRHTQRDFRPYRPTPVDFPHNVHNLQRRSHPIPIHQQVPQRDLMLYSILHNLNPEQHQ